MMKKSAALILIMALAGCAGQQVDTASIAQQEAENIPANYRDVVAQHLKRSLKDPYSVRDAEISGPVTGFVGLQNGGNGHAICVRMNAKNSFGAYIGMHTTAYVFKNSAIVGDVDIPKDTPQVCERAYFSAFSQIMQK